MQAKIQLCKHCSSRIKSRGSLKIETTTSSCFICMGIIDKLHELVEDALNKLSELEYSTLKSATRIPSDIVEREDTLRSLYNAEIYPPIKVYVNKLLDKELSTKTACQISSTAPDVIVLFDIISWTTTTQVNPLLISGRYLKLARNISQATWYCRKCKGEGCSRCNWTGYTYPYSIEMLISPPILEATGGARAIFHASGREDVDALMLGEGRPFIVEVMQPKRRRIDLKKLEDEVNKRAEGLIVVRDLSFASPSSVRRMKQSEAAAPKTYRVIVRSEGEPLTDEDIKKAEVELSGKIIHQWTPKRVLHRRANRLRRKKIYSCRGVLLSSSRMLLWIKCEGGLYIRELISGDDGRTFPSLSSLLSKKVICELLDVASVE